jgi:hypothetical protein
VGVIDLGADSESSTTSTHLSLSRPADHIPFLSRTTQVMPMSEGFAGF